MPDQGRSMVNFRRTCAVLLCVAASSLPSAASSLREWCTERGVSDAEWQMILDAHMPAEKIEQVLDSKATIAEYFEYRWLKVGYTETQWLQLRREGLTIEELPQAAMNQDTQAEWAVVHNFLLPGLHQFKRGQYNRAWPMAGVALLSVGLLSYGAATKNGTAIVLSLVSWLPDAVWSSVDIGVQLNTERNPDAARFTLRPLEERGFELAVQLPITRRY